MNPDIQEKLFKISFDSVDENADVAWYSLIQNLSHEQLKKLEHIFKSNTGEDEESEGLIEEEFLNAICEIYGHCRYSVQSIILYKNINKTNKPKITWNDFLDFLIDNLCPKSNEKVEFTLISIDAVPQTKRDSIVKIVLIETEKYFCYVLLTKYGKIGLYDGNLNFLTSYHAIMSREDLNRTEEERRRRNRWITDAIFCPDVLMFVVTNSARSIVIYEASGLNHVPMWLILTTPYIVESLAYKCYRKNSRGRCKSVLFLGQCNGELLSFEFQQPKIGFLRRKHNDKLSLFYWNELPNEKDYVVARSLGKIHKEAINYLKYCEDTDTILSCSKDQNVSIYKMCFELKRKNYCFKMNRGTTTFAVSRKLKVLITGSDDGTIRIWNPIIPTNPVSTISEHYSDIVDVQIMENQEIFLTLSSDGELKIWDFNKIKCIKTIRIKFPSFKIQGKTIEWGIHSIYPGAKRENCEKHQDDLESESSSFDFQSAERKKLKENSDKNTYLDVWDRSHILITCCNHIAKIALSFDDEKIENYLQKPVLPPPPLQNSVLIPLNWSICEKNESKNNTNIASFEESVNYMKFILNKDLFEGKHDDINFKIAALERKKLEMQKFVKEGAPYLALDLYDIKELKISEKLEMPTRKKTKDLVEKTKELLINSTLKDQIFSEPSSSRSKSSSSLIDFPL